MGTRAFTGNDSGCSGILQASGKRICWNIHEAWSALGSLPDETNTISIRLTEPKDAT